jgi:threonine dehydratase
MTKGYFPSLEAINRAKLTLNEILSTTPLTVNFNLSEQYGANVLLKREDLLMVRSYKIRGAYNKMKNLTNEERRNGVIGASAGNHAQGVAYSCLKLEIIQTSTCPIDYLFVPIGGGGLISGVGSYFRQVSPATKIIGVEPAGAPSMKTSLEAGEVISLKEIDKFVDGAAVQRVGDIPFEICRQVVDDIVLVPEGRVCTKILDLYNRDAIVVEPAGALSIAALDNYADQIRGKNVVCIVSGSNNDITRTEFVLEFFLPLAKMAILYFY